MTQLSTHSINTSVDELEHTPQTSKQPIHIHIHIHNTIELIDLLTDKSVAWQIHNCKLISSYCEQDKPLPFLYHYDRLSDTLKSDFPLTPKLLTQFNKTMIANEANELIGLPEGSIASPWFVKLKGSVVVYLEPIQLAVKLNWSNTIQTASPIYCQDKDKAIALAIDNWQFVGSVHVLNKNSQQTDKTDKTIVVVDTSTNQTIANHSKINNYINKSESDEFAGENGNTLEQNTHGQFFINKANNYQTLPSNFAVVLLTQLHDKKETLTLIDEAIRARVF